jgi:hypothetical protein
VDATGNLVVDAFVYGTEQSNSSGRGTITRPELATLEGDQGKGGCIVITPETVSGEGTSVGRFPDGTDTDSNCTDFLAQAAAILAASSAVGTDNIKVANVSGFEVGQTILIDSGAAQETAVIARVGTAGATTAATATELGANKIPVASFFGFGLGQIITIDSGANAETATVAMVTRRVSPAITFTAVLKRPHAAGVQISGTGLTLTTKLKQAHSKGAAVATNIPTPGSGNRYDRPIH